MFVMTLPELLKKCNTEFGMKAYGVDAMFKQIKVDRVDNRFANGAGIVLYTAVDSNLRVTPIFLGILYKVNAETYAAMDQSIGDYLVANKYLRSDEWKGSCPMIDDGKAEKKAFIKTQKKIARICWFHVKKAMTERMVQMNLEDMDKIYILEYIQKMYTATTVTEYMEQYHQLCSSRQM